MKWWLRKPFTKEFSEGVTTVGPANLSNPCCTTQDLSACRQTNRSRGLRSLADSKNVFTKMHHLTQTHPSDNPSSWTRKIPHETQQRNWLFRVNSCCLVSNSLDSLFTLMPSASSDPLFAKRQTVSDRPTEQLRLKAEDGSSNQ